MTITERFKRVADDVIQYQITIDDPVTYVRPFTLSLPLTPLEGNVLLPYDCHEGNLALLQSLGAERAEDRALAADLARGIIRRAPPGAGRQPAGRWRRPRAGSRRPAQPPPAADVPVGAGARGRPGAIRIRSAGEGRLLMNRRVLASLGAAGTMALVAMASPPVSGQSSTPALVITAYNGGPATPYTVPKTPWGDPDLQGVWSSDDATMPMSRPQNFGDRAVPERRGVRRPAEADPERASRNAENAVGSFRGDFARRAFRQTSLIVDPPDGRTPAFTAEAQKRRAPRDQGTFGNGPFDSTEDFTLYDRCITRGIVGSVMRVIYGNGNRIVQAPGMVAISYEMIHDTRFFYTDGRPHVGQASVSTSATRARAGKATNWWSRRRT